MYYINEEKIKGFKNLEDNDYYIITDFDHTLTTPESTTSVGLIPNYLGGELLKKRTEIFEYYRPKELDYSIKAEEKKKIMLEWATKSFTVLTNYITENNIKDAIKTANINFRKGVKELLKEMYDKKIPVIVMSSGVGNVVKEFFKKQECLFDNITIVSNFFEFENEKAYIDINNIMATSNKEYRRIPEDIRKSIGKREKTLLFGDLIEDIKMGNLENEKETLRFGFLDKNIEQNLSDFKKSFDIVLTNNCDFYDVKNIIEGDNNG